MKDSEEINLLEGEVVLGEPLSVKVFSPYEDSGTEGNLYITNFKLVFRPREEKNSLEVVDCDDYLSVFPVNEIPLMHIRSIFNLFSEKRGTRIHDSLSFIEGSPFEIICFTFRRLLVTYDPKLFKDALKLITSILFFSSPTTVTRCFAFDLGRSKDKLEIEERSVKKNRLFTFPCKKFSLEDEFSRCGANSKDWNFIENKSFVANKYGRELALPTFLNAENLNRCLPLFYENRIPHWQWTDNETGSYFFSSSLTNFIDEEDKAFLSPLENDEISILSATLCPSADTISNSYNKVYNLITGSPQALKSSVVENDYHFRYYFGETHWLDHVSIYLSYSVDVCNLLANKKSVWLKGNDGLEIIISLVQIIMDPFFRTIDGFRVLVEKVWLSLGHNFSHYHSYVRSIDFETSISPFFLLFLDTVHQLIHQNPKSFQFTSFFLQYLADESFSGKYGNFLFNTVENKEEKEKEGFKSLCIFQSLNQDFSTTGQQSLIINPIYSPLPIPSRILRAFSNQSHLQLWTGYFFRFLPENDIQTNISTLKKQWSYVAQIYQLEKESKEESEDDGTCQHPLSKSASTSIIKLSPELYRPLQGKESPSARLRSTTLTGTKQLPIHLKKLYSGKNNNSFKNSSGKGKKKT